MVISLWRLGLLALYYPFAVASQEYSTPPGVGHGQAAQLVKVERIATPPGHVT